MNLIRKQNHPSLGKRQPRALPQGRRGSPMGSSLVELLVTMLVMGVLVSMGIPQFQRSLEQSRADVAASNLRSIWCAQRLHWLNDTNDTPRSYADSLASLQNEKLLDQNLAASNSFYSYSVPDWDDSTQYIGRATRTTGSTWSGEITINANGEITGGVTGRGGIIEPSLP
jgi:type II secretory pathway pseudopilin PulG